MSPVLQAWIETIGVVFLAVAGGAAGYWCSRGPKVRWLAGYGVSLVLLLTIGAARRFPSLESQPPFAWVMAGRFEFALFAPVFAMLVMTVLLRLQRRSERILLGLVMVLAIGTSSVLPFLLPAFNYKDLARLATTIDADGVCLQSTNYTCGPAAAVTALKAIGISASEGKLAIAARTTRAVGTPIDSLCDAIGGEYGVECRAATFKTIDELRTAVPVIVVVKYSLLIDHFVTVLEVTDSTVIVGDPLHGWMELSYAGFAEKWRKRGIVLERAL